MKRLLLRLMIGSLLVLGGCSPKAPTQGTPPSGDIVLPKAEVMGVLVDPPRSILLSEPVNGVSQVWLDEWDAEGQVENRTQTYSANGCPLAGPPIQAGDTLKVVGRVDAASGRFVARTIWMLDVALEGPCDGPPAE
ncbi:MAG: hypothetical protein NZ528_01830 [Caldilineales bacterium]|nr:hypothetical protein [Caldilineales bacterium]MDW8318794.1 hypothetical protein [Anaerolineae bacterium]